MLTEATTGENGVSSYGAALLFTLGMLFSSLLLVPFFLNFPAVGRPEQVRIKTPEGERTLKNDFVFALTGYHPDYEYLESLGIELTRPEMRPVLPS